MAVGIVCIVIFFVIQPKPTHTPQVPTSPTTPTTPFGITTPPSGTPPLPSPTAAHKPAWPQQQVVEPMNTSFDLLGTLPIEQQGAIAGLEVDDVYPATSESLTTVGNEGSIAKWTTSAAPSFADCVDLLRTTREADIPVQTRGVWICTQTPEGLVARLRVDGSVGTELSRSYRFLVTVWTTGK